MTGSRRLRPGVDLGLAALAAALLLLGVRIAVTTALDPPVAASAAPAVEPAAARAAVEPLDAYAVITERDIFHAGGPRATAVPGAPRLRGIGVHGDDAWAVVEDPTAKRQRLVRVGDPIGDGRLAAVAWDHVVVRRGDRDETVALVRDAAPRDDRPAATIDVPVGPAAPAADEDAIRRTGPTAWVVDRRVLAGAGDGMSALVTQLRAVAEIEDGRPAGFRLFQVDGHSLFARLGLQDGDVVQRVNGKPVTEPATLLAFLKQLQSEPRVALDVVRGGTPSTFVYDLR